MLLPLLWVHNHSKVLRCVTVLSKRHQFFLRNLRLCSEIFGNLRKFWKMFGNVCLALRQLLENLWKVFRNLWKMVKKSGHYFVYIINKKYMAASRYVFNFKSHEWVRWTSEISSWTLKEKFHIYKQPCILYHNILTPTIDKPSSERGRFHLKSSGMFSILRRVVNHGFLSWFLCTQRKNKKNLICQF